MCKTHINLPGFFQSFYFALGCDMDMDQFEFYELIST